MISVQEASAYFLSQSNEDEEQLTHLKLQKLLYYAQCASLAECGKQLFSDSIQAWEHGPVVPAIWQLYKSYKGTPLPVVSPDETSGIPEDVEELLSRIYKFFAQYSAWKLRELTHEESAWVEARKQAQGMMINPTMSIELMRSDYLARWQDTVDMALMTPDEWRRLTEANMVPSEKARAAFAAAFA